MSGRAQQGMLVLADVNGFTAFLAQTELEHAHDILLELTQLVVTRLQPSLTVAEVEGDAVFACSRSATPLRRPDNPTIGATITPRILDARTPKL